MFQDDVVRRLPEVCRLRDCNRSIVWLRDLSSKNQHEILGMKDTEKEILGQFRQQDEIGTWSIATY